MSGRELRAQRKLAFHVLGSDVWPSVCFPATSVRVEESSRQALWGLQMLADVFFYVFVFFSFVFLAHMLTCVDGPLLEETGVLLQVPAVTGCVLPWNSKHGVILEDTQQA